MPVAFSFDYSRSRQRRLLRNSPWCNFCEKFGRHLDPASPDEGPRCVYWTPEMLDQWDIEAEAVIASVEICRRLWPEVTEPLLQPLKPCPAIGASLIERIKSAYRIEDVAHRLTELRGTGTLTGKCPLHREEHGRSFVVWVDSQRWRCYGTCSKGGDVIDLWTAARQAGLKP